MQSGRNSGTLVTQFGETVGRQTTTWGSPLRNEEGFVLATILVFVILLTLSAFAAATLTRVDVQLVENEVNEKQAFYAAEAGIAEGTLRLGLANAGVTVDGVSFDPRISPDSTQSCWQAQVLFNSQQPTTQGTTFTAPTLQPAASRLAYSTAVPGDPENLTVSWVLSGACSTNSASQIKKINGKNVLRVVSTGRAGAARRKVTVYLTIGGARAVALDPSLCGAVSISGSARVSFAGGLTVNSSCQNNALNLMNSASLSAPGESIDVVGGYQFANSATSNPTPTTGASPAADPFQGVAPPDPTKLPVQNGSASSPSTKAIKGSNSATLSPGIYYGGISITGSSSVVLQPGTYYLAGGGFSVSSSATVVGSGVTIYNTNDPSHSNGAGAGGAIQFSGSASIDLAAPATGPTAGILLFQDPNNGETINMGGSASGSLDGAIYAPSATLKLNGWPGALKVQPAVGSMTITGSVSFQSPTTPLNGSGRYERIGWLDF